MHTSLASIKFSHQYVADLAWVISALPLLGEIQLRSDLLAPEFIPKSETPEINPLWLEHLITLNHSPAPLIRHIEQRHSSRVGFYYEALISYLLTAFPGVELIQEHLQLQQQGKTLGEIDFLYRDLESNTVIHLETAVKFYLGVASWQDREVPYKHWLGPMIKDRLDLKTQHLIHHQTQISKSQAFLEQAKARDIPTPTQRQILMQGYLFIHPDKTVDYPHQQTPNAQACWFSRKDVDHYLNNDERYLILRKPYWLSPYHCKEHNISLDRETLKETLDSLIEQWHRPILVSIISSEQHADQTASFYQESNRCFIVPDNWAGMDSPK